MSDIVIQERIPEREDSTPSSWVFVAYQGEAEPIKAIRVWCVGNGSVFLEGINENGILMNSGFAIPQHIMDRIAERWLRERGML